jgi:superfamily I DNA/RNA helicase
MSPTFWISTNQLDPEQRQAVEDVPANESFLLKGPAGSGKTNILLLRAKWLILKKLSNLKIVVFTASLRDFVIEGCHQYGLSPDIATTQMAFFKTILLEYGVKFELTSDFETDRTLLAGKVKSLIESGQISDDYCGTLLIDESQDYTDTELLVFRGLTKNLILAADSRQSIYQATHAANLPEHLVNGRVVTLKHHYRSGLKLCTVADGVLTDAAVYPRLTPECGYPEKEVPSSVVPVPCPSLNDQFQEIVDRVSPQFGLYPHERIGVLFPKKEQVVAFINSAQQAVPMDRLRIYTLHAAKGWEFRAVHIGGCETLTRMGAIQKRLIYTGILRGKTSVHLYFTGRLPGYLDAALALLQPPEVDPPFESLF